MSTRLVSVDDLVTVDGIAKRLRISVNAASNIVRGRDGRHRIKVKFPKPLVGKGTHGVWLWADVEAWKKATTPKTDESKKKSVATSSTPYRQPSWAHGRKTA